MEPLTILAETDLTPIYRLVRLSYPSSLDLIPAGAILTIQQANRVVDLPCMRTAENDCKLDILFLLDETTSTIKTGMQISQYTVKYWHVKPQNNLYFYASLADRLATECVLNNTQAMPETTLTIIAVKMQFLGAGLGLALSKQFSKKNTLFLFELKDTAPFRLQPSALYLPYLPDGMIANFAMLEENGIAGRVVSTNGMPGNYDGTLDDCIQTILANYDFSYKIISLIE